MTNALYVASLAVTGLLVVALAVALLVVLWLLHRTSDTLGKVVFGIRAIAHRTEPLEDAVVEVNTHLTAVRDALRDAVPPEEASAPAHADSRAATRG